MAYRTQLCETVEALQADLNAFLAFYNKGLVHQGYRTQGRTSYRTFLEHQQAAEVPHAARSLPSSATRPSVRSSLMK